MRIGRRARMAYRAKTPSWPAHRACFSCITVTFRPLTVLMVRRDQLGSPGDSAKPSARRSLTLSQVGSFMPTIALVDDDRNILTSVSLSLEAEGYRVQTYTDGASALEGLKGNPPDLAIFDIKMPRMDGMELLRRLRGKAE